MADACDPVPGPPKGNTSGRKVMCKKLGKELPGLDAPPWPGELGQRVYENISAQAWKLKSQAWLGNSCSATIKLRSSPRSADSTIKTSLSQWTFWEKQSSAKGRPINTLNVIWI